MSSDKALKRTPDLGYGIIYVLTNPTTGMRYVGQTTMSVHDRCIKHKNKALKQPNIGARLLHAAIIEYGIDSFEKEVIDVRLLADLDRWEMFHIQRMGSLVPAGYNLELGGRNGDKSTPTKQKMSKTRYENNGTPERYDESLPTCIHPHKNGYKITRHPKCSHKTFIDSSLTAEENLAAALAHYRFAEELLSKERKAMYDVMHDDWLFNSGDIEETEGFLEKPQLTYEIVKPDKPVIEHASNLPVEEVADNDVITPRKIPSADVVNVQVNTHRVAQPLSAPIKSCLFETKPGVWKVQGMINSIGMIQCKNRTFSGPDSRKRADEFVDMLCKNPNYVYVAKGKGTEIGISELTGKDQGYMVSYKVNGKTIQRKFTDSSLTMSQKYALAKELLHSVNPP